MNSERWGRIGELFDAAASVPPADRREWLRTACDGDDGLQAEVESLLRHDDAADREGFFPDPTPPAETVDWPAPPSPRGESSTDPAGQSDVFSPRAAIAATGGTRSDELRSVVQSRLRQLPLIHILTFGMMILLRPFFLGRVSPWILVPFIVVVLGLAGVVALLSTRRVSLPWLRRIELGMVAVLAGLLLFYSARGLLTPVTDDGRLRVEHISAERIMKNAVLLASLLMFIHAVYIPTNWRRVAIVSGLLALLPLVSPAAAALYDPSAAHWLVEPRPDGNRMIWVLAIDVGFLFVLAGISSFAAQALSKLRSEVVAARRFGQYRLGERIGSGGMGEVYLAEHELLKRPCAIKLIRPDVVRGPGAIRRFEKEVYINATLSHPNTVEIFDYGLTEDGTYYYVMEYLPGMSLADLVAQYGPLPPGRVVYLLRQVALALHEAHQAGLIHRDVKPSNIFAARRGGMDDVAKLLDFGLVHAAGAPASTFSDEEERQILGTPLYMSPEQASGSRTLDPRSDIYSLGAVAYYLLTGWPPFEARTPIEVFVAHARDPIIPPSQLQSAVQDDLEAVVLRCLAKAPQDRFPDAEAFEAALGLCRCASDWDKARARQWWLKRR
ncbi:protein kinase domain-containing protein [Paludisphaera rhizosphaerae]|uniref:protein kinase domain-containing protein n=1 Tax=Paludisphaera rhizosphaerae TaxID=2711216 RepID=UPI0013E9A3D1|nr:protein kinase [Paludisphaera rhizosphaerae]